MGAQIAPASILAGWNGSSTAIRVRVNNSGTSDSMEFYDAANATPLNLLASGTALRINGDHVRATSMFNATIARSGTTVTVTIGSLISGGVRSYVTGNNPMVWQTNPAMTNTPGKGLFPTTVTETGALDVDF